MGQQQLPLALETAPRRKRAGKPRSFHLRAHETVAEAEAGESRAERQDGQVLAVFRALPDLRLTPSEVHDVLASRLGPARPPLLTSVRRSITGLTKRGLLVHYAGERRMGPRGGREGCWGLA